MIYGTAMKTSLLFAVALATLAPQSAEARDLLALSDNGKLEGGFVQLEVSGSLLTDAANKALLAGNFGYGLRGGYRWGGWGLMLHFEQSFWLTTEQNSEVVQGAFNIGLGGEVTYARGFVRTSLTMGPSILAFDTALDDAGTTGFYFDLRPAGLRWAVHDYIALGLDPIHFTVVAPVLGGIPLIQVQYRTSFYVEGAF